MALIKLTNGICVDVIPSHFTTKEILQEKVSITDRRDKEDPFYIVNLGRLIHLHKRWYDLLPTVKPFYAVKCNDDPLLLQTLAALGTGFDCASRSEIRSVLDLGVDPSNIIYANPCKQSSHLKFATKAGVNLMTFDNEEELHKIKYINPSAKLVLRILADDPTAICNLGLKFGAEVDFAPYLLSLAKKLDLAVVGVSFHVGSGAQSADAYAQALAAAKQVFIAAEQLGFKMELLDIGGGFPGSLQLGALFQEVADTVNSSLANLFGQYHDLKVIAEPGRYFACSTHTLAVNIISKRCKNIDSEKSFMYYVNDGVYGSFNCVFYDHTVPKPEVLKSTTDAVTTNSSVWGPTCDGLDKINDTCLLPELNIGDWLLYKDMGAYTISGHSSFNGFAKPIAHYYCTDKESVELEKLLVGSQLMEQIPCQFAAQTQFEASTVPHEINCC